MAAPKGHKKSGGRKKGTPNKTTASVKAALVEAFDQLGGVAALVRFGREKPAVFYQIWAKLLPTEVKATVDATVSQVTEVVVRTREEARVLLGLPEPEAKSE